MAGRTKEHAGKTYTVSGAHPAADLYPWFDPERLQALADDIRVHKLKHKIVRCRGVIVDGRNRELACLVAGVKPEYLDLPGDTTEEKILAGVHSANLRRDLTASQRAMIAANLANMRQGERTDKEHSATVQKVSQADAAGQMGVSPRSVANAAKVKDEAPELAPAVLNGKLPVALAARAADLPPEDREEIAGADDPAEEARHKLDGTLPVPMHDNGKRPAPKWMVPGNKVDPSHPFAPLLQKLSAWSGEITKLFKTEQGKILLWALGDLAGVMMKTRYVLFASDKSESVDGSLRSVSGKFVGFYALRSIVKKAGLSKKRLSIKQVRKTFLDAIQASEQDILDAEGWE